MEPVILRIIQDLVKNAARIRKSVSDGNLVDCARLVGERTGMIEELRNFVDARGSEWTKVSESSSDIRDEVNLMMKHMQDDVTEAMKTIMERSKTLLTELANMRRAKEIAAYAVLRKPSAENVQMMRSSSTGSIRDKVVVTLSAARVEDRHKMHGERYGY